MASHPTPSGTRRRGRAGSYVIPPSDLVRTMRLGELLPPWRSVSAAQQERLGITGNLPDGPRLWCVGDLSLVHKPCVAIVGTRSVSQDGAKRARRLARELAEEGVVVVSGLAKGVDTEALSAALSAGGRVVGVIGTPIDKAYPAENKSLQERIYREDLLVSQFAPSSHVFPTNFPTRNKLMAAVSDATVIIEASDSSGTLHQAAECRRLGRWLFIARSLLEDPSLTWPSSFRSYARCRALTATSDVMEILAVHKT